MNEAIKVREAAQVSMKEAIERHDLAVAHHKEQTLLQVRAEKHTTLMKEAMAKAKAES